MPSPPPRLISSSGFPRSWHDRWAASHEYLSDHSSARPHNIDKKCLPSTFTDFLQLFGSMSLDPHRLQFTLGHQLHSAYAARRRDATTSPADRIRLTALTMPHARCILNADLTDGRLSVNPTAYRFHMRFTEGRSPSALLSLHAHAQCGLCNAPLGDDPWAHWFTCRKLRRLHCLRHKMLITAWHELCEMCGLYSLSESHLPNGSRSDNFFCLPTGPKYHTDTSVVHPGSFSYLHSQAQFQPGYAASSRAQAKYRKYQQVVESIQCRFRAVIFETYGGTSRDVDACLQDLHQAALWKCLRNPPSIDFMRQYLQKALIEGNGLIIGEGLKTVRFNERTAHPE